jgi:hypothetical protein
MKWTLVVIVLALCLAGVVRADTLTLLDVFDTQSDYWSANARTFFTTATAAGSGTLDSLYVYVYNTGGESYIKGAIYNDATQICVDSTGDTTKFDVADNATWLGMSFYNGNSITASTDYRLEVKYVSNGTNISTYNITPGTDDLTWYITDYHGDAMTEQWASPQDTSSGWSSYSYALRIYAIYTPSAAADTVRHDIHGPAGLGAIHGAKQRTVHFMTSEEFRRLREEQGE